jgi:thioredoxin-like negative regulator of GroEL
MPFELNDLGLMHVLLHSERPVVVAFVSHLSVPCDHFAPEFQSVAEEMVAMARFFTIDGLENPTAVGIHGVEDLPTTQLFVGGKRRGFWIGPYAREALGERLAKAILEATEKP